MTDPIEWTDIQSYGLFRGVFFEHWTAGDRLIRHDNRPMRIRVENWALDIFIGSIEHDKVLGGWVTKMPDSEKHVDVLMCPRNDDDWKVYGKMIVRKDGNYWNLQSHDVETFRLEGSGPSLDAAMMRAKLADYIRVFHE